MSSGSTHLEHIKNKKDEAKSAVASQEVRRHLAGFIMSKRSCSQLSSADSSSGGGSTCASSSKQKSLEQQVSIASLQSSSASNDVCLLATNAPLGHEQYAPGTTTSSSSIAAKLVDEHPLRKTASMPTMHIPRKSQSVSRRKQMERRTTLSPLMRRQQVPRVARRRTSQQQQQYELAGVLGTSRSGSSSPKQQQHHQRGKQKLSFQHHRNQLVTLDTFDEEMFRNDLQQAALNSRLSLSGFQNKPTIQQQHQQHQTLFKTSSNPQLPGDMDSNASNDIDMIDLSEKKTADCGSDSVSLSRNLSNLANKLRNLDALGSDFTNSDAQTQQQQQQQQQHFVDAHTLLRQQQHKKVNQAIRKTVLERSSQTNRSRALIGGSLDHPDSTCRPLGSGYSSFAAINQRSLDAGSAFGKRATVSPMLAHQNSAITTPRCSALRQQHSSSSSTTSTSSLLSSSQQDSFDELIAQAIDLSSSNCDPSSKRWPSTKQQQQAQLSTSRLAASVTSTSTANCPSQNPAAHSIINTSATGPSLPQTATLDPIYNQKMLQDSFNQLQLCQAQQQQQQQHQVVAEQQTLASYRFAAETANARQRLVAAHRDTYSLDRRLFGGNSRNAVTLSTQLSTNNTTTATGDSGQANLIAEWHSQQQQQQPTLCQVADYEKHQLLASQSSALLAHIFHHHQQIPSSVVEQQHNQLPQRRHESLAATGRALSSPLLPFAMSEKQQVLNEHLLMLHRLTSVNQHQQTLQTQSSETSAIELLKQSSNDTTGKQSLQRQPAAAKLSFNFSELDSEQVSTRFILNPIFDDSSSTGLTYDLELCNHKCICNNELNHPENSKRVLAIWRRLHDSGLMAKCARIYTRPASLQDLQLCHSQAHCLYFATTPHERIKICEFDAQKLASLDGLLQLECGGIGVDIDTAWNEYLTPKAARLAAGGAIQATLAVASGKLQNAFAIIRPPGHHAEHQQVMGFCFFNNIAIAAKTLLQTMPNQFERILIVDLDIHHGNGTQKIFYDSNTVMYISLHRHDNGSFFPGTGYVQEIGIGAGRGYNWNIAWFDEMMADCEYITAFQTFVMPLARQFEPQIVLVACGFDAARGHPANFGGYKVSAACFNFMISLLKKLANGRLVLCLEGGYQLDAIADCAEQCVRSLLGDTQNAKIEHSELSRVPVKSAIEVLEEISVLAAKFWPNVSKYFNSIKLPPNIQETT